MKFLNRVRSTTMTYVLPKTLAEALEIKAGQEMTVLAGGTDVFPAATSLGMPDNIMDISAISDLRGISDTDDQYRFGALTTWSDIANADLPAQFDCLKQAALEVGSIQIQNAGTIAGNLCNASPAADGVPPLLALNAQVELSSKDGVRVLPIQEFVLGNRRTALQPGELVSAVLVPKDLSGAVSHFIKLGSRKYLVISITMVAVIVEVDDQNKITQARISVGACSEVAMRIEALEQALIGCAASDAAASVKADYFSCLSPISDVRAKADYRRNAAVELVTRALAKCAETL